MKRFLSTELWSTGFALFSMFFGAGNIVFPLALGRLAGDGNAAAILGFVLTAVGVPFLGLISMVFMNGDYKKFFYRIGVIPGFFAITSIVCLIGPFGAMPRLFTVSYSAIKPYVPLYTSGTTDVTFIVFSIVAAIVAYVLSVHKGRMIDVLGYVLSPILIVSLAIIIIKGLMYPGSVGAATMTAGDLFTHGLTTGFNTMDLLATGFFAHVVLEGLRVHAAHKKESAKNLASFMLQASVIGATLLGFVYVGISFVAASYGTVLGGLEDLDILGKLAHVLLGSQLGFVANVAVMAACLTTVVALAAVFADFLYQDVLKNVLTYKTALILTMTVTMVFSWFGFSGLQAFLAPIVTAMYPAIVVLCIANIAHEVWGFRFIKTPVFITLIGTLLAQGNVLGGFLGR